MVIYIGRIQKTSPKKQIQATEGSYVKFINREIRDDNIPRVDGWWNRNPNNQYIHRCGMLNKNPMVKTSGIYNAK